MTEGLHTKRTRAQFGGPTTSDKYNERITDNFKDLSILFNRVGVAEERLTEIIRQQHKTITSLDKAVSDLEERIGVEGYRVHLDNPDTSRFVGTEFNVPLVDRLESSYRYSTVGLPRLTSGSESRIRYTDSGQKMYLPSSFQVVTRGVSFTADGDAEATINESNVFNAFLNQPGRVWERNVVVNAPNLDGAAVEVYIGLPVEVAPSLRINKIMIDPFPSRGVDVEYIGYSTKPVVSLNDTDGYVPLNEKNVYSGNVDSVGYLAPGAWDGDAIRNAGAVSFEFDPKDMTAIKLVIRTRNYYIENGKTIYTYGLADFDARSEKHLDQGRAIFMVTLPDGETASDVLNVEPEIYNVNPIEAEQIFDYRVIWETAYDSGIYTTDPVPFSSRFWIEVTLRKTAGGGTPILSGIDVEYS